MTDWIVKVDLQDLFDLDNNLTFEERRNGIVERIRSAPIPDPYGDWETLIDDLAVAEDEDEFDDVWNDVYDLADNTKVWLGAAF